MNIFDKVYFGLLFITLLSYAIVFRKKEKYLIFGIAILLLWLFTTGIAIYLSSFAGWKNNLFVFHISTPLEYMIFMLLYRNYVADTGIRKIITFSIPVFILTSILFSLFIQPLEANNSYMIIIESLVLIFVSLFFLRETLLLQQEKELHRYPMFWISVSILFYYTGTLIIEGMLNYLITHSLALARRVYRMSYFIKYFLFLLFIIAAFCRKAPLLTVQKNSS